LKILRFRRAAWEARLEKNGDQGAAVSDQPEMRTGRVPLQLRTLQAACGDFAAGVAAVQLMEE